jgi:hypothetical protein
VVLDVTANTPDGNVFFQASKSLMEQATNSLGTDMVLGPDKKLGLIRDTSIQPFAPTEETFEIPLPSEVQSATINISLSYQLRPGDRYPIHSVTRKVSLDPQ